MLLYIIGLQRQAHTESELQNWPPGLYGGCQHLSALAAVIQYSEQIPLGKILLLNGWNRSMHLQE